MNKEFNMDLQDSNSEIFDGLEKVLQSEFATVEAYDNAAQSFRLDPELAKILRYRSHHLDAIEYLEKLLLCYGERKADDYAIKEKIAFALLQASRLFGVEAVLSALILGEEHGAAEYEKILKLDIPEKDKNYIKNKILLQRKRHISTLKLLVKKH